MVRIRILRAIGRTLGISAKVVKTRQLRKKVLHTLCIIRCNLFEITLETTFKGLYVFIPESVFEAFPKPAGLICQGHFYVCLLFCSVVLIFQDGCI